MFLDLGEKLIPSREIPVPSFGIYVSGLGTQISNRGTENTPKRKNFFSLGKEKIIFERRKCIGDSFLFYIKTRD